jgi:uncharacterized protein DUF5670
MPGRRSAGQYRVRGAQNRRSRHWLRGSCWLAGLDADGKETHVLELVIVVLVILWLLGYFGPTRIPRIPQSGNLVHVLLVIVLILILVRLLR